jgi:ppGpp synthetase/RelA/SpoT-type nucleotidyltranferase
VPLPISGSQFDKLGVRLKAADEIHAADLRLLERVLEAYDDALTEVQSRLREIGYEATTRLKTTQTLVEKLRRTPGLTIRGIHDIAGARIVLDGGRFKQDSMVSRIIEAFAAGEKQPQVLDRRANPSFGYRAVHIVAFVGRLPVEIQVRTDLQHRWAEIAERLGDQWGRGMRYGTGPEEPGRAAFSHDAGSITREGFAAELARWSATIDEFEQLGLRIATLHARGGRATPEIAALYEEACTVEDGLRGRLKLYLTLCDEMG